MTILTSYAQEESLSASENQKWRVRKAFENGELINLRFLFGYSITADGVQINEKVAVIVREIFSRFNGGESMSSISRDLMPGVIGARSAANGVLNGCEIHCQTKSTSAMRCCRSVTATIISKRSWWQTRVNCQCIMQKELTSQLLTLPHLNRPRNGFAKSHSRRQTGKSRHA